MRAWCLPIICLMNRTMDILATAVLIIWNAWLIQSSLTDMRFSASVRVFK